MTICDDLRQSVLQAAIQGKLTKQLSEDGTAGDLLASIKAEKEQLIKEKKIKKEKPLTPISEDELPFDIPDNWEFVRITDCGVTSTGTTPPTSNKAFYGGDIPFVGPGDISYSGEITYDTEKKVTQDGLMASRALFPGAIMQVCIGGSLGKCCVIEKSIAFNQQINALQPILCNSYYLLYVLSRKSFIEELKHKATGTATPILNRGIWEKMMIPLPPLAEQHRIVARVNELMAKIDELEAVEKELVALKKAFPSDMKASLLQAAMQGKLTRQLPEESVAEIENYLHIDSKLCPIKDVPFDIPENWKWIQIGNLGESADTDSFADGPFGSNLKREHQISEHEVRIIQLSNIGENGWKNENEKYTSYDHLEKVIPRCEVTPGCFVIAKMMPAGRTILVPELGTRITLGSDAMKFKPNSILNKKYLLYAMRSQAFLGQVYAEVHGITRVRTTLNGVKGYVLPIPPLAEQQRIVEKLDKLLPLCDALKEDGVA